jgi:predicted AAA+ superfamily ATPase
MKNSFTRRLKLDLPESQSAFLWGARKTGKSTYLKQHFPEAKFFDLLLSETYLKFVKSPHLLREEVRALPEKQRLLPIIIDEVQKVPILLDEVHWMIENLQVSFVLCGSSARKLKRGQANMLGGRAWRYAFYPLSYCEVPDFDLLSALNRGLIPSHYLSKFHKKSIKAYIENYLLEEIKAESLVRNLPAFAKFLDAIGYSNGELINYVNIAQDCAIDAKTVKEYFQILEDTLLGTSLFPYKDSHKRSDLTVTPKFYLFDVGVAGGLMKRQIVELKGTSAGDAFEHFIYMELLAYRGLNDLDHDICFWRTRQGLEVDFILGKAGVAIEVKIKSSVRLEDVKGLVEFKRQYPDSKAIVVCTADASRIIQTKAGHEIVVLPWKTFLDSLWQDDYLVDNEA